MVAVIKKGPPISCCPPGNGSHEKRTYIVPVEVEQPGILVPITSRIGI